MNSIRKENELFVKIYSAINRFIRSSDIKNINSSPRRQIVGGLHHIRVLSLIFLITINCISIQQVISILDISYSIHVIRDQATLEGIPIIELLVHPSTYGSAQ